MKKTKKETKKTRKTKISLKKQYKISFNKTEKVMFVLFFLATFGVVSILTFTFPNFKTVLHNSNAGFNWILFAANTPSTAEPHPSAQIFKDVSSEHPNATAISFLKSRGVIKGFEDGSFKPDEYLNRAELIKFIVSALNAAPLILTNNSCFTDVKNEWFASYVCYAKNRGWVTGFEDGSFHPADNVTKVQALKMVMLGLNIELMQMPPPETFIDVDSDNWSAKYIWTAQTKNWLEQIPAQGPFNGNDNMTRAQTAELLFRVITQNVATI